MSATKELKEAYIKDKSGQRYNKDGATMMQLLLLYSPRFLELDALWIDALVEAQQDARDSNGWSCLMYLLCSRMLGDFDFGCRRFQALLQQQQYWVDSQSTTAAIVLCYNSPQLLSHEWATGLVRQQSGKTDDKGMTALVSLF